MRDDVRDDVRDGVRDDVRDDVRDAVRDDVRDDVDVRDAPVIQAPGERLRQLHPLQDRDWSRDCAKNACLSARARQHFTRERNSS